MSKYRYGKSRAAARAEALDRARAVLKANTPLNRELVEEEVAGLRDCIDEINDLLSDISDLSFTVQERIGDLENSITVLEEEL